MIDILMATCNGGRFLPEQLDSLLGQTVKSFRVLIHDDGSRDNTRQIIRDYESRHPQKIHLLDDGICCGSAVKNFLHLTKYASGQYVMYCDQDDVWLPEKISISLDHMKEAEAHWGTDCPVLVFAAYRPVDAALRELKKIGDTSLRRDPVFSRLLVENCVSGCVMMCNRALYRLMGAYDEAILMHDWWAALIAAAMGQIVYIPREVMLYRQHGGNSVGAVETGSFRYRLRKLTDKETRNKKNLYYRQAALLRERFADRLGPEAASVLDGFLQIPGYKGKLHRMYALNKRKHTKSDPVSQIGFTLFI